MLSATSNTPSSGSGFHTINSTERKTKLMLTRSFEIGAIVVVMLFRFLFAASWIKFHQITNPTTKSKNSTNDASSQNELSHGFLLTISLSKHIITFEAGVQDGLPNFCSNKMSCKKKQNHRQHRNFVFLKRGKQTTNYVSKNFMNPHGEIWSGNRFPEFLSHSVTHTTLSCTICWAWLFLRK